MATQKQKKAQNARNRRIVGAFKNIRKAMLKHHVAELRRIEKGRPA